MLHRISQWVCVLCVLVSCGPAAADRLEVTRSANVKKEPRGEAPAILHADPGVRFELVDESPTNGYYRVKLADGRMGWIYRTLVKRIADGGGQAASATAGGKLEVYVMNVGQADAILIRCPDGDHEMLIDAADTRYTNSSRDFKASLQAHQRTDNKIEVVVATHPHADHIGNMAWVLNTYPVGLYVDNSLEYPSATYRKTEGAFDKNGADYWGMFDELVPRVDFCDREEVDARVLRPSGFGESSDPNDNSVVVRVDYGNTSFLFVGDCEEEEEKLLLDDANTTALLDCDFLKVGHHGSNTSSSDEFLAAVTPKIAAISCGAKGVSTNEDYKHPRFERLDALLGKAGGREGAASEVEAFDTAERQWKKVQLNKAVYVTTADGDLVFESDGTEIHRRVGN